MKKATIAVVGLLVCLIGWAAFAAGIAAQPSRGGVPAEKPLIVNAVMRDSMVIERLSISDKAISIDTESMLAAGYNGAQRFGPFVVYELPAWSLEEPYGGAYDGYYERGDPFPDGVQLVFAWKLDGTAFIGAKGPDALSIAPLVDGWVRIPFSEQFVGDFIESQGFRKELRHLIEMGFVSGLTLADFNEDGGYYPFLGDCDIEIFHRFDRPIFRVASALYLEGIPGPSLNPVMDLWCPLSWWGTGYANRGFDLDISGASASYAMAIANNDNGNSSSISLNGQVVVSNNHCCQNSWRRTGIDISSVFLETNTVWSQGAPMFNMVIVADDLSVGGNTQTPPGGLSNNHPPIVSKLPPGTWTRP